MKAVIQKACAMQNIRFTSISPQYEAAKTAGLAVKLGGAELEACEPMTLALLKNHQGIRC